MVGVVGGLLFGILIISYVIKPYIDEMLPTIAIYGTGYEVAVWALLPVILLVLLIPMSIYALRKRRKGPYED